jgi:hypothetical protein
MEPTPAEVAGHLRRSGASEGLADKAAEFFRACDAARFAPSTPQAPDDELAQVAHHLINTLEAEPWSRLL